MLGWVDGWLGAWVGEVHSFIGVCLRVCSAYKHTYIPTWLTGYMHCKSIGQCMCVCASMNEWMKCVSSGKSIPACVVHRTSRH
mmetsp:Transcript_5339/g.14700  ORF Transcript_5339/g.14700 Transcript_5339/m.14700 type:complete len:83 (+) Transcript_5339:50-298(+)